MIILYSLQNSLEFVCLPAKINKLRSLFEAKILANTKDHNFGMKTLLFIFIYLLFYSIQRKCTESHWQVLPRAKLH